MPSRAIPRTIPLTAIGLLVLGLLATPPAQAESPAKEYFWPAHREALDYRIRSHGLRDALHFSREGEVQIAGQTWQQVSVTSKVIASMNETIFMRVDDQGIYTRYSTDPQAKAVRELALPLQAGASWPTVNRDGSLTRRTIDSIADCQLRDARFERCVRVSFSAAGGQGVAYFAPGYGEVINSQNNGFKERSLVSR